ncbi:MAG TPA: hypothetical protein VKA21_06345 [Candidatus Binatia bacterium]|nr:hypothetical protein [Candidatus Binatia bacterium]
MRATCVTAVLGVVLVFGAGSAESASRDHLKCHKVKDTLKLPSGTTADLGADFDPDFTANGCRVVKPKLLCSPIRKENVQPSPPLPISGLPLNDYYICYSIKCTVRPPDKTFSDQFGFHQLTKIKPNLLCVPAQPGAFATTTSTAPPVTTTTTTTTLPPTSCCGAERIVLTSTGGTHKTGTLPATPFPAGATLTIDSGTATAFPGCQHAAIVPAGGLAIPPVCLVGLDFTATIEANGCAAGADAGTGLVWDGGAACPMPQVSKDGDSSDGVCNPAGQPCNSTPGGAGSNTLGDVDATRGGPCIAPGLHALVDIPAHETWWIPPSGDCPDPDGTFDPGTDTLIMEADYILSLSSNTATTRFADENGDSCSFAGGGPAGPFTETGAPALGPCCVPGQTMTLASGNPLFSGTPPLADVLSRNAIQWTVSQCTVPGSGSCTLPNGCMD